MVSVAGVHQEVSKQTRVINKSEVYSHYLGLLFLTAHQGWKGDWVEGVGRWRGKPAMPYKNKEEV